MDPHYFLIGTDGRHYGPLSQADVRAWLADGRASRHSRARRATEDGWLSLRDMSEFEAETRPSYVGTFAPDLSTPAQDAARVDRQGPAPAGAAHLDPVSCFRRAWWVLARDFAVLAGFTLLVAIVISAVTVIPRVGLAIGALLNNLLMCGIYVLYLSRMRGLRPSFNDVATAVRTVAVRIVLAGLVQSLLTVPIVLATIAQTTWARATLLVLFVPCLYLLVAYVFMLPLIVDQRMTVWGAMELSRRTVHRTWFQVFGLLLAAGMLLFLSTRLFGVLLVVTLPLCTAALMVAYEDLFGRE
jgi:hypothetical protein